MGDTASPGRDAPQDLKIDPVTGELVIENGDLVIVTGLAAIAQAIQIRLRFFLGEWFLDPSAGVDWFGTILGHKGAVTAAQEIIRKELLSVPGVASIARLVVTLDGATRTLSAVWSVGTNYGALDGSTALSA